MRINKFVAQSTGISRRAVDDAIRQGRVQLNASSAALGDEVLASDKVTLDGHAIIPAAKLTILLNKPRGYVTSRNGQGTKTIYDLLPSDYHTLKPVGRLDKDSSGLILLTNDGDLANQLTHPKYSKTKIYEVELDKPLEPLHQQIITDHGIELEDGKS
jgi:23S rRNA pseudouridine2605 synthase